MTTPGHEEQMEELRRRLEDAEETLRAIRSGEVDALVVEGPEGARVYTLQGADHAYRTLIEAMQQGALSLSAEGTVLFCNRSFAGMVKRPQEKVIGAAVAEFFQPADRLSLEAMLRPARGRGIQEEFRLQAADGSVLPVYVALAPLPPGDAAALCMLVTDLTDQKKHQDLQEANRRKDEFLAMLAHELRNPLAPIRNALHIIQARGRERRHAARLGWEVIERQVEHLVRLVDDLLDVSRINRGRINLQKEPVDVAILVARAVESSRPIIEARRHRLEVTIADGPLLVNADPTRMAQVLLNLLNNSAKYTPEGGRIWLTAARADGEAVIKVRDTGVGIAPEILPKVFDLFTQAERTLDRAEGGLGIGLTLVRRLTEMHDGTVQAFSAGSGAGSEFVVRLPLLPDARPAVAAAQQPAAHAGARPSPMRRILVVDDNQDSADSLAMLLRLVGHDVRTVHDGRQALVVAAAYQPEVVLLDIGLPGMDGFAVARHLRALPEHAGVVLVALTGYGNDEDRRQSKAAGFDHHMVKPVHFEALNELLAALETRKESLARAEQRS